MVLCLFSACSPWWKAEQDPSCANIVKIVRFDKAVDDFVRTGNVAFSQRLSTDYPMETRILVENMLHLGSVADELIYGELRAYYCHAGLEQLSADVRKRFANLSVYERQLGAALNRLKSELPGLRSPYVYTQISGFRQSIVVSDTLVGISLDKYMGADYPAYARFFTPVQRGTMTPGRMVPDLLSFYLMAQFPPREEHKELIYAMIQIGKIQWAVAQALDTNTASASGFSEASVQWLQLNEQACWRTLKQRNLLFSTQYDVFASLVPLTAEHPYFGDESSRGAGTWMGTQVVRNYMRKHPECTLYDLLVRISCRAIWEGSDYAS